MSDDSQVLVIGAGMAGMAAAAMLGEAGIGTKILEARDRIGGRVFTHFDPGSAAPIELGAEFIHGLPREIWQPLQRAKASIHEVEGDNWCVRNGELSECSFFEKVDAILKKMDGDRPDESFLDFLQREFPNPRGDAGLEEAKRRAVSYVTGFNAADPSLVGVNWLMQGMHAEEELQGDRAFRLENGYQVLVDLFRKRLNAAGVTVRTATVVEKVTWKPGHVEVTSKSEGHRIALACERVLVTLPLAVLQARAGEPGAVEFSPALPAGKIDAMSCLKMGMVIRVVLRFRNRFWNALSPSQSGKTLDKMSFLFSEDEFFPTWWTRMPDKLPIITGWAPFRSAERLSGKDQDFVVNQSLRSLGKLFHMDPQELRDELESAHFHDWQSDPFSQGAYSYGKVGSHGAQLVLGTPVQNTLFFAGEATDTTGNNGTVHAAIRSGCRAANEILQAIRSSGLGFK